MRTSMFFIAAGFAAALAGSTLAQDPGAAGPTLERRVAALEAGLATLDTRLGLANARAAPATGDSDLALAARIGELERAVERLTADLQRVERMADSATRAAMSAQRDATSAQQAARDAVLRAR